MKNCPICHRHYSEQVQYCTRDGTKLISAVPFKNHCSSCNKYYPPGLESCPVHGIALKDAEPAGNDSPHEALESEPQKVEKSEVLTADDILPPVAVTSQPEAVSRPSREEVPEPVLPRVAHTRELGPPSVPSATLNTMMQYSSAGYASADRRLLGIMAVVITLMIGGLVAYGLSRPSKQARITGPATVAPSQSAPSDNQVAEVEEGIKKDEGELVQRIELSNAQQIPEPRQQQVKPAVHASPAPSVATASATKPTRQDSKERLGSSHKTTSEKPAAGSKSAPEVSSAPVKDKPVPVSPSADRSGGPKMAEAAEKSDDSKISVPEKVVDRTSGFRISSGADKHSDDGLWSKPKSSRHPGPKIMATVSNKSRIQIPNGYIYQFDLILQETTGQSIKWRSIDSRKVSYSGRSAPVNSNVGDQQPVCNARYHVVVKMTGTCIEDWYGQFVTVGAGVDDNGNPIEIEHILLLDDSFPNYSGDTYRYPSSARN